MNRAELVAADVEYVALLDLYAADTLAEVNASDWDADDIEPDYERSAAWSCAFENDDEARLEMEADDMRCGGSFSELLHEGC